MVFRLIALNQNQNQASPLNHNSNSSTNSNTNTIMAAASSSTATIRPPHQPLHNFPLQDLKWSSIPHGTLRKSPHPPDSTTSSTSADVTHATVNKSSKLFIRIKTNTNTNTDDNINGNTDTKSINDDGDANTPECQINNSSDVDEALTKTWNLRPRKPLLNKPPPSSSLFKQETKTQELSRVESTRSQRNNDPNEKKDKDEEKEKDQKRKLSIPLSKEEIEEDIYALTGSRPARRPKRRPKHIQKQLDFVFPGLWLSSVTPDDYRVSEPL